MSRSKSRSSAQAWSDWPSPANYRRAARAWPSSSAPRSVRAPRASNRAASGRQWGTRVACRLASESAAFYEHADERLAAPVPLGFRACGYLFLAHDEAGSSRLAANVAVQNGEGVPSRLVSADEAAELVPGLRTDSIVGGAWCAADGYFDRPQSVVEAFARGLEIRIGELGSLDELNAETIVVAAGADTPPPPAAAADRARGSLPLLQRADR